MPPESPKNVLVVDDDIEIRNLLRPLLTRQGLSVDDVADGAQALELIQEREYAVVVLDLLMPAMDGFTLLDKLNEPGMVSPVVLVITGADREAIATLDPNRIHGVVRKPFDPDEIVALVVACAELKSRGGFGTMAIATMIGSSLLELLNRLAR